MIRYAMQTIGYQGAIPSTQFVFEADNPAEATNMMRRWAIYQGLKAGEDCSICPAKDWELETDLHNEYIPGK